MAFPAGQATGRGQKGKGENMTRIPGRMFNERWFFLSERSRALLRFFGLIMALAFFGVLVMIVGLFG